MTEKDNEREEKEVGFFEEQTVETGAEEESFDRRTESKTEELAPAPQKENGSLQVETNESFANAAEEGAEKGDIKENRKQGKEKAYGKFSNSDALYSAYVALEAEFTKKSQRLKELEKSLSGDGESEKKNSTPCPLTKDKQGGGENLSAHLAEENQNASDKNLAEDEVIKRYLSSLVRKKIPLMRGGGAPLATEKTRPRSLKEAKSLALGFFQRGEE